MSEAFTLRALETPADYRQAETLQRRVWGFDDAEVIPLHVLLTAQKNGGLVLGAYLPGDEAKLIGLLFGFSGRDALGRKHCSHILGVASEARGLGVGRALKWDQRRRVLRGGETRITWTFDPLQATNAHFNLRRLGALSGRYFTNLYGEMRDDLNRGMPSDRLEVDWWLRSDRVQARAEGKHAQEDANSEEDIPTAIQSRPTSAGHRVPESWQHPGAPRVLLEVPTDLNTLKKTDVDAALAWRHATREAFSALFADGYVATDVQKLEERVFYLLERYAAYPGDLAEG